MIAAIFLLSFAAVASAAQVPTPPANASNPAAVQQVLQGKRADASAAWWGFNEADSTTALQDAFNSKAKRVLIPYMGKPWIVRPLFLRSNQEIDLAPGVIILAKRGEFQSMQDSLFTARDISNLTIRGYGATLRMWKHDYQNPPYKKGEWRMGIALRGVKNVRIEGLRVENTGGDGFYVDGGNTRLWSEDVTLRDCVSDNNHRQGVSVISAVNLTIENCVFSNTSGTAPEAGIDLEPDEPNQRLQNIVIRNSTFENNQGHEMLVYLNRLNGTSAPVSILFDHCVARMTKPTGGWSGMAVGAVHDTGPQGIVEFRDCTVESAGKEDAKVYDKSASGALVRFVRCHWNHAWSSPHPEYNGPRVPVLVQLRDPRVTHMLGKVDFVDSYIYDTVNRPSFLVDEGHTGYSVRDLHGHITVQNPTGLHVELGPTPVNTDLVVAAAK